MRRLFIITTLLFYFFSLYAQVSVGAIDLAVIDNVPTVQTEKIDAAMTAMKAVQDAGAYVESLADLFTNGEVTLPVGIKKGSYSLIIDDVYKDEISGKPIIHASCAFKFKGSKEIIAFEGEVILEGQTGLGASGKLSLIAPVRRDIGKQSTLVIREGTTASFDCDGIEAFDAKMAWVVTSDFIIPSDENGTPTNSRLQVPFEAQFSDFDSYTVSLGINQSFTVKGLTDMVFTLKGATLDQSDTETPGMVKLPDKYFPEKDPYTAMWKGVAVAEASVSLPQVFKKTGGSSGNERINVALKEVLFDENGLSCNAAAENIVSSDAINPQSWDISLDAFSLGILKNSIASFGFGGEINLPPFGKHSLLPYTASFNPVLNTYEFNAGIGGEYDFPALASTLNLNELSTIKLQFRDKDIYPSIRAHGVITVNAPLDNKEGAQTLSIPDIAFENMVISRESPYVQIGNIALTGGVAPKLGGFELSISDIQSFENTKGSGVSFQAHVAMSDQFGGVAGILLYGDYEHWKLNKVEVEKIRVDYQSPAYSIAGGVWFKNGDPVFGDGFRGDITLKLIDKFTFDAIGVFGKKADYRYFLADVFYEVDPKSGVPIPPVLSLYGFGGGLYMKMQQSGKTLQTVSNADLDFGKSLSGISYLPDKNVGLGVMSTAKFALNASDKAFNAKVGFEMQFNSRGGLDFVQLRGDAAFMDDPTKWGSLADNVTDKIKKVEQGLSSSQPQRGVKTDLASKIPENKGGGFLTASMLIEYDLINKTFSADMSAYLNAAGIIKGIGPGDRLGWASAYFAPNTWHTYMGTPSDRMGVSVLGLAELNGYFMLGDGIPALPPPPQSVLKNLSPDKQNKLARSSTDKLGAGKGIAFGAAFDLKMDAKLPPFYAHLGLGLGSEFMLTSLNGKTCAGISGTPGINGWYAQGQAWAYVEGSIGMGVKVFGSQKNFDILSLSTSALLEGAGPNPLYFAGAVGGQFNVLGGLVKGNCNFDFEVGDKCKLVGGSPFGEDIIAQLSPGTGEKEVSVFAAPQAIFNIPVESSMTINEEDGTKGTYKITLEEFRVKDKSSGKTTTGKGKYSSDGTVYVLTPNDPFESQKDIEVYAKVGFKKFINNKWEYVKGDNGQAVFEEKTATFRSGDRPKEILLEHVKYSYPMNKQYNFYANEYKNGYILVTQNYEYLFKDEKPEGFEQKIRISDANGKNFEKPFTYTTSSDVADIRLAIDFPMDGIDFAKNKIYKVAIMNIPLTTQVDVKSNVAAISTAAEGVSGVEVTRQKATETLTQLSEKEIYALHFRSSNYATFSDKIKAFDKTTEGWRDYLEPFVHYVKTNLKEPELFDSYEIQGVSGEPKMVRFDAQVAQTAWFTTSFYQGMYQSQTYVKPQTQEVEILTGTPEKLLTADEMSMGMASGYNTQGIFRYALPYYCARDFFEVKKNIAVRALSGQITQQEVALLATDFPPVVLKGTYPVNVSYVLPGKEILTSTVGLTMYCPVTP